MPHISLKAEKIFDLFGLPITNSYITSIIVIALMFFVFYSYKKQINRPPGKKSTLFYLIQYAINAIYDFFRPILGDKIDICFPVAASFFLYILLVNWFGLLPGVGSLLIKVGHGEEHHFIPLLRGTTADLNTTIGLGMMSVILSQYFGISTLGIKEYVKKFYNLKNPISFFIGTLEIVSEFSKMLSFGFRLFGNIFAGEVVISVIAFLIPVLATFPFLMLEFFVGFMQAVIFATLTSVFMNMAMSKAH